MEYDQLDTVNQYDPSEVTPPHVTVLETIQVVGMDAQQFAELTGWADAPEFLAGKRRITEDKALDLERVLGVGRSFWANRQARYDRYRAVEVSKHPPPSAEALALARSRKTYEGPCVDAEVVEQGMLVKLVDE